MPGGGSYGVSVLFFFHILEQNGPNSLGRSVTGCREAVTGWHCRNDKTPGTPHSAAAMVSVALWREYTGVVRRHWWRFGGGRETEMSFRVASCVCGAARSEGGLRGAIGWASSLPGGKLRVSLDNSTEVLNPCRTKSTRSLASTGRVSSTASPG